MSVRKVMRYVFYKLDPAWRLLPNEERTLQKKELLDLFGRDVPLEVYTYSTVGLRADADICLWEIGDRAEELQEFQAMLNGTAMGRALIPAHSFLAMTGKSVYLKGHKHEGQEADLPAGPVGSTYLFVYPLDKQRHWYRLPYEERRRIMGEHFRIGHRYPGVRIHTGYSFGIDDQEFVVAFESESIAEFLDLVMELRESESSSFTARDVPIFTCVRTPLDRILDQLDGAGS